MKISHLSLVIIALFCGSSALAESIALESPDGHLKLPLEVAAGGAVTHSLALDGKPLISPSPVGFSGGRFVGVTRREEDFVWKPVWGKRTVAPDRYREATLDLGGCQLKAQLPHPLSPPIQVMKILPALLRRLPAVSLMFTLTATAAVPKESELGAYLLVYFKDDTHSVHMALSSDGYRFSDVNGGHPMIDGKEIAEQKGIRDPHITRGPDGAFYLVMTDLHLFAQKEGMRATEWERDRKAFGWGNNRGFVFMRSPDLIRWSRANVRVDQAFPGFENIGCAWAPQTIYDAERKKLMVYFTMRFGNGRNRLYYSCVDDAFTKLETEPKLLFEYPKDISYIDGDITKVGNKFHLFYVAHDGTPGIKQAVSDSLTAGYVCDPAWCDPESKACEAPNVWKRIGEDKWVLMYDSYGIEPHNFGFCETTDFKTFTPIGRFNEGAMKAVNFTIPKHGSVIPLTPAEARKLADHWKLASF